MIIVYHHVQEIYQQDAQLILRGDRKRVLKAINLEAVRAFNHSPLNIYSQVYM